MVSVEVRPGSAFASADQGCAVILRRRPGEHVSADTRDEGRSRHVIAVPVIIRSTVWIGGETDLARRSETSSSENEERIPTRLVVIVVVLLVALRRELGTQGCLESERKTLKRRLSGCSGLSSC